MARIEIHPRTVTIVLSALEKVASVRSRDVVLDRSLIRQATITDDPKAWIRGVCTAGTRIPRYSVSGVWRHHGGRDFLLFHNGKESIVLDLDTPKDSEGTADSAAENGEGTPSQRMSRFTRVVITTKHAAEIMKALEL